ncbi:MAG: hydrolase [Cellvibrionaceae bacterium]
MKNLNSEQKHLMDFIAQLEDQMISLTRQVANINSGSHNLAGLNKVHDFFDNLFSDVCDSQTRIPLSPIRKMNNEGVVVENKTVEASLYCINPNAPVKILCTGHTDTVFPEDCDFQSTWIEGNHLRGPGVADMKGGLIVLYHAIKAIHQSTFAKDIGFFVLLSPDEEIGSPVSAEYLTKFAKEADVGMVYEPALEDGTLAGVRKGSGNFSLSFKGHATHAGRNFFEGKNALVAAAEAALALSNLSNEEDGVSVNIGKIIGGGPVNIVPDSAVIHFNFRVKNTEQQQHLETDIQTIMNQVEGKTGCQLTLSGHFNRPPKPMTPRQEKLFETLKSCAAELSLNIQWRATGGCCEGNNLAAAGLPNIDTLGVRGGAIHSADEFACLDSFVERAQLSALFMSDIHRFVSEEK